jgi:hypothetical protein
MADKVEEKINHTPCKQHGRLVCTKCNPVMFVTTQDDPFYQDYRAYWLENGRELCKNHKELKAELS